MNKIPDCFCDNEGISACDWEFMVKIEYRRPGDSGATTSECPWILRGIPQLLAQALFKSCIEAVNNGGHEVFKKWLQACADGDDLNAMAQKVMQ